MTTKWKFLLDIFWELTRSWIIIYIWAPLPQSFLQSSWHYLRCFHPKLYKIQFPCFVITPFVPSIYALRYHNQKVSPRRCQQEEYVSWTYTTYWMHIISVRHFNARYQNILDGTSQIRIIATIACNINTTPINYKKKQGNQDSLKVKYN